MRDNYSINIDYLDLPIAICNSEANILHKNQLFSDVFSTNDNILNISDIGTYNLKSLADLICDNMIDGGTVGVEFVDNLLLKISLLPEQSADKQYIITVYVIEDICVEYNHNDSKRLDNLFSNTPVPIVEFDADWLVVRWSPKAEEVFGWNEEEVIGKHPNDWKFIYEDDTVPFDEFDITFKQHNSINQVNRNYRKDGTLLLCEWSNSTIKNCKDEIIGFYTFATDVTELKETMETLENNLIFLETLADCIPFPIYYKKLNGILANHNNAFRNFFLDSTSEYHFLTLEDLPSVFSRDDYERIKENEEMLIQSSSNQQLFDLHLVCNDGMKRDFIVSITKFLN